MADDAPVPAGYVAFDVADARVVCRADCEGGVRAAMGAGSLYAWAAAAPGRQQLHGRAAAYAARLPGDAADVVVRHSWHGGLLARLTRDLFLPPTRAPRELAVSLRLAAAGVRTPEVVAYAVYRAGRLLRRADVATRLVASGRDLAATIADPSTPTTVLAITRDADACLAPWVRPTGLLLHALARAGARHPDLNLKNVLLTPKPRHDGAGAPGAAFDAWALDVDVVKLSRGAVDTGLTWRIAEANWERLARSLRKWRDRLGLPVHEADLDALREYARRGPDASLSLRWVPHNSAVHAS